MDFLDMLKNLPLPLTNTSNPLDLVRIYKLFEGMKERGIEKIGFSSLEDALRDPIGTINEFIKQSRNAGRRICSFFSEESDKELKRGDIIGICRGVYDHYGVYVSDSEVIHYSSPDSDISFFSSDSSIIATDLDRFLRGDNTLFKLHFPKKHELPDKIVVNYGILAGHMSSCWRLSGRDWQYRLYSPDETVKRARSRLGENSYDLFMNNCEHFAIWCKTGISESHQVNMLIKDQRDLFRYLIGA